MAYNDVITTDSPGAYWRFEETTGTSVADAAGTNALTITGANLNVTGTGDTGSAIAFDGTNDKAESASGLGWNGQHSLTVEMWMNLASSAAASATPDSVFLLWRDTDGYLAFQVRDAAKTTWAVARTTMPALNAWHHVVGVWDRPAKRARLYLNGELVASSAEQTFENIGALSETVELATDGDAAFLPGTLDEVAIYNTALAPIRVLAHYAAGGGTTYQGEVALDAPHLWYRLEETAGTSIDDFAGTNDGTASGTHNLNVTGTGKTGSAIDFTSGKIDSTALSLTGAHDLTVEAWLNLDTLPATPTVTPDSVFLLWRDTSGNLAFQVRDAAKTTWAVASTSMPSAGAWHHVVGVWDRTAQVARLYLNGALANSSATQAFTDIGALSEPLTVGDGQDGRTDEVAIYTTLLSAARVEAHYLAGRSVQYLDADVTGTGDISSTIDRVLDLDASISGTGDLTSAILAVLRFTAASSGTGDVTTGITRTAPLTSDASGTGDLTSAIRAVLRVTAASSGAGDVTSSVTRTVPLASGIAGSGDLTSEIGGAAGIEAAATGTGDLTLDLLAVLRVAAASDGNGDLTASVRAIIDLAADPAGAGDITTTDTRVAPLASASTGAGDLTTALIAALRLTAATTGSGDITSDIDATRVLASGIAGDGDVTTALLSALRLASDASGAGDITSDVIAIIDLAASASGAGDVSGTVEHVAAFTLTPASSSSVTNIVDQDGLTINLHAAIDEGMSTPDGDTTYLVNTHAATGSVRLGLTGVPSTFQLARTINVRVRARRA